MLFWQRRTIRYQENIRFTLVSSLENKIFVSLRWAKMHFRPSREAARVKISHFCPPKADKNFVRERWNERKSYSYFSSFVPYIFTYLCTYFLPLHICFKLSLFTFDFSFVKSDKFIVDRQNSFNLCGAVELRQFRVSKSDSQLTSWLNWASQINNSSFTSFVIVRVI